MSSRSRKNLTVMFFFLVGAYVLLVALFWEQTRAYAVDRAEKQIEDVLLSHKALHSYVERMQKPEIYRLKEEGQLYGGYFSPRVLSFTYIARNVKKFLNEERKAAGLPELYFKLASDNPRNPINRADPQESRLLARMNRGEIQRVREVVDVGGSDYLYVAIPINATRRSCMRCHGDPADAPAELIALYGDEAGFHEETGVYRAMISIRAPLEQFLGDAQRLFYGLSGAGLVVLASFFALVWYFIQRLDRHQRAVLEANHKLERLSQTDYLTGLANRLHFSRETEREIGRARRYRRPVGLVMLDLDHFKVINDTRGHDVGDQVLVAIAGLLQRLARSTDLVARWGGEEFIVLLREAGIGEAQAFAERVHEALNDASLVVGLRVTASFGVTELDPQEDLHGLEVRADQALYRAKQEGRNRVAVLPPGPAPAQQAIRPVLVNRGA